MNCFTEVDMPTVKDVAKLAGVSVGTVSRYLNNPDKLSSKYYIRVQQAIEKLDYNPSILARSLRTKRTHLIAYVTPQITNPFFAKLYDEVHKTCAKYQYKPVIYTYDLDAQFLKNLLLGNIGQVDGVILSLIDNEKVYAVLDNIKTDIPIALITARNCNKPLYNSVVTDLVNGSYDAANYLISIGHKRIAYVGMNDPIYSKLKFEGTIKCLTQYNISLSDEYIYIGPPDYSTGFCAAERFMQLPEPPTAIISGNDILAVGCLKYLLENHYSIPKDVAVIGFDDIIESYMYYPSISTVNQHISEMGALVAEMLINKINYPNSAIRQTVFRPSLVIRQSTQTDM